MKRLETRRLAPDITVTNLRSLSKVKGLKGYKPTKDEFSQGEITAAEKELTEAREAEAQAEQAKQCARNRVVAAEWALHHKMLGAKKQIVVQYGEDSDEVQAVGLKKKSEYKRSGGRKPKIIKAA